MSKISQGQKKKKAPQNPGLQQVFPQAEHQWLAHYPHGSVSLPENAGSKELKQHLWPDALDYHNPLNSVVLAQIEDLESLNIANTWFIRDGYIGIYHFFQKFPQPKNIKATLYIHSRFTDLVPKSWRPFIGSYGFQQKKSASEPNKILICGLACLSGAHEIHRLEILTRLKKELGTKNLTGKEMYLFMPARQFNFMKEQTFHAELFYHLFRFFSGSVEIVNWNFFTNQKSFEEFLVVNMNPSAIWSDSYINNYVLSKGGTVFDIPFVKDLKTVEFQLSNFHGLTTNTLTPKKINTALLKNLNDDPSFYALPWRSWFNLKAVVK